MICSLKKSSGLEGCHLQLILTTEIAPTSAGSLWIWNNSLKVEMQNGEKEFINSGWNWIYILFILDVFFPLIYHSIQVPLPWVSGTDTQEHRQKLNHIPNPTSSPWASVQLSGISADNNPVQAGDRNPVLFTHSRRCYVPHLQIQLLGKTSREMQHLLLKITGQRGFSSQKSQSEINTGKIKWKLQPFVHPERNFVSHLRTSVCHLDVPSPKIKINRVHM